MAHSIRLEKLYHIRADKKKFPSFVSDYLNLLQIASVPSLWVSLPVDRDVPNRPIRFKQSVRTDNPSHNVYGTPFAQ